MFLRVTTEVTEQEQNELLDGLREFNRPLSRIVNGDLLAYFVAM
jgi:hypothetical protein